MTGASQTAAAPAVVATTTLGAFAFDNSYARDLVGAYVPWPPARATAPRLLFFNQALATELRLDADALAASPDETAALFAGNVQPEGAQPIAQAYAGHQFGGFSPQLGDGRALLLGEVIDVHGARRDVAFKGSGRTPFSRSGDGRAAVGPMLREVLIGEAMHALGIPTTRALAVVATGDAVLRERVLPGAVLTRIAASHLRVGTFQFFAARGDIERLRRVAEHAIARHDPALVGADDRHVGLLRAVAQRQARLVAQWMNVGFIHGVMNTDNMTLSGETIDYGPCAFMEAFDPDAVFSSIDTHGRYAYANQPSIAQWNLARFAEALLPLIAVDDSDAASQRAMEQATEVIDAFPAWFDAARLDGQRAKLGLAHATTVDDATDRALADDWLALLHTQQVDFTLAWRRLADAAAGDRTAVRDLFVDRDASDAWLARWQARCAVDDAPDRGGATVRVVASSMVSTTPSSGTTADTFATARAERMRRVNPWVIPRNHRVEEALAAASDDDDLAPFEALLAAVTRPYDEAPGHARFAEPAPIEVTASYRTFCGT